MQDLRIVDGDSNTICVLNDNIEEYIPFTSLTTYAVGGSIDRPGMLLLGSGMDLSIIDAIDESLFSIFTGYPTGIPTGYPTINSTLKITVPDVLVTGLEFNIHNDSAAIEITEPLIPAFYDYQSPNNFILDMSNIIIADNYFKVTNSSGDAYGIYAKIRSYDPPEIPIIPESLSEVLPENLPTVINLLDVYTCFGSAEEPLIIADNTFEITTNGGSASAVYLVGHDAGIITEISGNTINVHGTGDIYGLYLKENPVYLVGFLGFDTQDDDILFSGDIVARIHDNAINLNPEPYETACDSATGIYSKIDHGALAENIYDNTISIRLSGNSDSFGIYHYSDVAPAIYFISDNTIDIDTLSVDDVYAEYMSSGIYLESSEKAMDDIIPMAISFGVGLLLGTDIVVDTTFNLFSLLIDQSNANRPQLLFAGITKNVIGIDNSHLGGNSGGIVLSGGTYWNHGGSINGDISGNIIDVLGSKRVYGLYLTADTIGYEGKDINIPVNISGNIFNVESIKKDPLVGDYIASGIYIDNGDFLTFETTNLRVENTYVTIIGNYLSNLSDDFEELESSLDEKMREGLSLCSIDLSNFSGISGPNNVYGININNSSNAGFENSPIIISDNTYAILSQTYLDLDTQAYGLFIKSESSLFAEIFKNDMSEFYGGITGHKNVAGIYLESLGMIGSSVSPVSIHNNYIEAVLDDCNQPGSPNVGGIRLKAEDIFASISQNIMGDEKNPGIVMRENQYDGLPGFDNTPVSYGIYIENTSGNSSCDITDNRVSIDNINMDGLSYGIYSVSPVNNPDNPDSGIMNCDIQRNDIFFPEKFSIDIYEYENVSSLYGVYLNAKNVSGSIISNKIKGRTNNIQDGFANGIHIGGHLTLSDDTEPGAITIGTEVPGMNVPFEVFGNTIDLSSHGSSYGIYMKAEEKICVSTWGVDEINSLSIKGVDDSYGMFFEANNIIATLIKDKITVESENGDAYGIYGLTPEGSNGVISGGILDLDMSRIEDVGGIVGDEIACGIYLSAYDVDVMINHNIMNVISRYDTAYGMKILAENELNLNIANHQNPEDEETPWIDVRGRIDAYGIYFKGNTNSSLEGFSFGGSSEWPISINNNNISVYTYDSETIYEGTLGGIYGLVEGGSLLANLQGNTINIFDENINGHSTDYKIDRLAYGILLQSLDGDSYDETHILYANITEGNKINVLNEEGASFGIYLRSSKAGLFSKIYNNEIEAGGTMYYYYCAAKGLNFQSHGIYQERYCYVYGEEYTLPEPNDSFIAAFESIYNHQFDDRNIQANNPYLCTSIRENIIKAKSEFITTGITLRTRDSILADISMNKEITLDGGDEASSVYGIQMRTLNPDTYSIVEDVYSVINGNNIDIRSGKAGYGIYSESYNNTYAYIGDGNQSDSKNIIKVKTFDYSYGMYLNSYGGLFGEIGYNEIESIVYGDTDEIIPGACGIYLNGNSIGIDVDDALDISNNLITVGTTHGSAYGISTYTGYDSFANLSDNTISAFSGNYVASGINAVTGRFGNMCLDITGNDFGNGIFGLGDTSGISIATTNFFGDLSNNTIEVGSGEGEAKGIFVRTRESISANIHDNDMSGGIVGSEESFGIRLTSLENNIEGDISGNTINVASENSDVAAIFFMSETGNVVTTDSLEVALNAPNGRSFNTIDAIIVGNIDELNYEIQNGTSGWIFLEAGDYSGDIAEIERSLALWGEHYQMFGIGSDDWAILNDTIDINGPNSIVLGLTIDMTGEYGIKVSNASNSYIDGNDISVNNPSGDAHGILIESDGDLGTSNNPVSILNNNLIVKSDVGEVTGVSLIASGDVNADFIGNIGGYEEWSAPYLSNLRIRPDIVGYTDATGISITSTGGDITTSMGNNVFGIVGSYGVAHGFTLNAFGDVLTEIENNHVILNRDLYDWSLGENSYGGYGLTIVSGNNVGSQSNPLEITGNIFLARVQDGITGRGISIIADNDIYSDYNDIEKNGGIKGNNISIVGNVSDSVGFEFVAGNNLYVDIIDNNDIPGFETWPGIMGSENSIGIKLVAGFATAGYEGGGSIGSFDNPIRIEENRINAQNYGSSIDGYAYGMMLNAAENIFADILSNYMIIESDDNATAIRMSTGYTLSDGYIDGGVIGSANSPVNINQNDFHVYYNTEIEYFSYLWITQQNPLGGRINMGVGNPGSGDNDFYVHSNPIYRPTGNYGLYNEILDESGIFPYGSFITP